MEKSDFFRDGGGRNGTGDDIASHSVSVDHNSICVEGSTSIFGHCSFSHHDIFLVTLFFPISLMRCHLYNGQKKDFLIFLDSTFLKESSWLEMVNQSLLQDVRTF